MFGVAVALACGCSRRSNCMERSALGVVPTSSRSRLRAGLMVAGVGATGRVRRRSRSHGLTQLRQSHLTSGQFDEGGNYVWSYRNGSTFVEWAMRGYRPTTPGSPQQFRARPNIEYTAHRVLHTAREMTPTSSNDPDRHELAFAGLLSGTK